ncbi:DUF4153 domain-containing protein [Saccharopolyspora mangrovi]|uniref:DUF4173 domain-containing protein n=1 Tax=Saccharopolyspora mangrovi TaxID=3082379 RepID=A0ABU6AI47_9PSEU|nr:DUF4173 domain-containing protein [Saccharopolyspora sp. S2-29]MEB3371239.1 DUF4173 domain-containing protein [Saccharopolyspora sp. S2-29]
MSDHIASPSVVSPHPVPAPPLFDSFWPKPDTGAPRALLAALISGLAAAVFLPLEGPGIGWTLFGAITTAALLFAVRDAGTARLLWAATGALLLTVCALRSAEWLAALCVLTSAVAAALAITGARAVRELVLMTVAVPIAACRALPWAARGMRGRLRGSRALRMALSVLVALALLLIFGALFSGADENFARIADAVMPELDFETFFRATFVFGPFTLLALGAAFTALRPPRLDPPAEQRRTLRGPEWAIPIGVLVALFALFIVVQAASLFGGPAHVRDSAGLTFSAYARSGFWQLTLVTILTLPVIAAAARWAPKRTTAERNLLRGLAGALAVLTLVIVGSALARMVAYQDAYGYTVLRLLVMTCEIWLGVVYAMIIAAGLRLRAHWLPTAVLATAMGALLALAALNPEGAVAGANVTRFEQTGKIDPEYLATLSPDALPAIDRLPTDLKHSIVADINADADELGWRSWNLTTHLTRP